MKKQFLFNCWFILLLVSFMQVKAQNLSNRGIDFWVGYGHHQFMESGGSNSQEMVLYLSAEQAANVTVKIEGTTWVRNYAVPANSVIASEYIPKAGSVDARLISLPCSFVPPGTACGGEGVFSNKGIHITSDVPIVAYAHIFGSASSGATMLMPVESWGNAYITLNSKQSYAANCFSWAYVIAQKDNTVVEITPTALTRSGKPANVTFSVTLNRGQIYQLMAGPESGSDKPDLSGTKFKSVSNTTGECTPIAVFAGSSRTANPGACGSGGGDNDNQQCFPTQAWGKRYLTAPTSNSVTASSPMINIYKIARKDATTIVKRNGVAIPLSSFVNNVYTFETNTADYIIADKPIMLAQFMTGGSSCQGGGGVGDPEMMYLSPIEQGIKRVGFYRNNREGITVNYLTLVIPTAGVSSLRIDGSAAFSHSYLHPNLPGYSVVVKRWSSAQAQAVAQSDSAFTAVTYGLGSVESYGYNAGTLINNLSAVGSIFNSSDSSGTVSQHPFTCTKTPVKLSVLLGYPTPPTKLIWRLSQVGGGLSPNTDVIDNSPTPVGTTIYNGITYLKFELPGTYTFQDTGYFKIPILATHITVENCNNTEEVYYYITVKGRPTFDFSISSTGCVLDTVYFTAPAISTNGFALNKWTWTFPDLSTSNTQNTSKLFLTPGIKNVNLKVISTEGCVGDTTKPVSISAAPISGFKVSANPVCYGIPITFTDSSTYTGAAPIGSAYWDFGDGTIQTVNNINPVTHTYTTTGTFWVRHSISMGSSCQGDTAGRSITVSTPPITTFNIPAGCLPANGLVQFNSTAYSPDGLPIANHLWNFGDPASGVNNTSNLPNPTHTYANSGTYTLTYSAATANGCTKDTTVIATFNFIPALNYPVLTAVCENAVAPINIATATVTNGGIGTGVYSGPGTSASGSFNPAVAGPGTHTIKYIFTATGNCVDSITQTILVYPKPSAAFAIVGAGCLPPSGIVNFNYNGTVIPGQTYLWDFGHPASGAANASTNANPTHNYPTGPFTIKLTVTTTNGCKVDSIVTNTFNVKPALAYPALAAVCENSTTVISVATATVTNGATGTGVYSGPGTSASGSFNPAIAGPGTHTIKYIFTATGNCVDSITQTILVYPKASAAFAIVGAGCLAPSGIVNFNYNGTVIPGQTYLWDFGHPASGAANASTNANPSHNYPTGPFTIKLSVTTTNGCKVDSIVTNTFNVKPALNYPALAAVCENSTAVISVATATVTNGATGTGVYSGPGTNAAGSFNPALAGPGTHTIKYIFTATGNCVDSITQTILVYPKPSAAFAIVGAGCLPPSGIVNFNYNGTVIPGQTYLWDFGHPASGAANASTNANPTHNYPTGPFTIKLTVTTTNGCKVDSIVTNTFNVKPALAYPALAAVCQSVIGTVSVATATVTNGATGTGVYSGSGTTAAGAFSPSIAGAGTHTIKYIFTASGNCVDSITQTILVYPKPAALFTYPTVACLPTTGLAAFTYTGSMSASQTYAWNFGDITSGANNISSLQNPSHNYTNTGLYTVKVVVTNSNGCVDSSIINKTFSVTPALNYPALAAVCQSVVGTINVATATVTNAVTGTGIYSGPGVDAAGNFSPSIAGAGTHIITYTFTSTGNCVTTITQTIKVNPKPVSTFSINNSICLGQQALVTDNSTISIGSIVSWKWDFADGDIQPKNNNAAFNKLYGNFGNYIVKLITTSLDGCISDTAKRTIIVNAIPVAAFAMPASVCMPGGNASFINNSTVADGTSLTYSWSFGDGSPAATTSNANHVFAAIGNYTINLKATSSGGCFKDSSQQFNAFFVKPIAKFIVTPSVLCQGNDNVFQDQSTAANSSIKNRLWIFGDGSTSTAINPVKKYSNPGVYKVKLVVINNENCISDTFSSTITVYLQPVIDAGPNYVVAQGTIVRFFPIVNDSTVTSFLWSPAALLSNPTALRPTYLANADQNFTLTATVAGFCKATDLVSVKILRPVICPNAFSPNGDGVNDTWVLENLSDYPDAQVEVYNRYGQIVFTSYGYNKAWDGTYNGKPLPVATYYYIIQLNSGFKPLNGSITIIR